MSSTITFDFPGESLAPPGPGAAPALTAQAAFVQALNLPAGTAIPAAQCEADNSCGTDTIVGGTAYEDYQVLACGCEWSTCGGSLADGCAAWEFVNANTGADLGGIRPRPMGYDPASPSALPSASAGG